MDNKTNDFLSEQSSSVIEQSIAPGEVIIGQFLGFNSDGEPLVNHVASDSPVIAMSTVAITHENVGRQVALLFANGDFKKPVIMGFIYSPLMDILNNAEVIPEESSQPHVVEAVNLEDDRLEEPQKAETVESEVSTALVDGNRVVLEGKDEIVLKCGEASITLTKSGKILIRGKYLLNRSSGVNRIMGGSVQVN
ncbi:hypothetical protein FLL45_00040 [Aliikangiella marina]|uniref:DUF6484 domain-containing protein n=1 Tax=Aliikangiella marina TaxID=1712262 RepID=A0A545TGQ2_9GAMM|nr:DUF6484 domain-containing protein [Aliikangiella marina]TQV76393.1 hypothetical protein FLL45_00040 [Aliikangiella marina]